MRDITVTLSVRDAAGNLTTQDVIVKEQETAPSVLGGYYKGSGANIYPDTIDRGMNLGAHTTYRSFADGSIFPGYNKQWTVDLMNRGVHMNYVLEWKFYGNSGSSALGIIPRATMQQRPGTTWPKFFGWSQVLSGECDPLMDRAITQLNTLPVPINVQFTSERDTDHEFGITDSGVSYSWVEADELAVEGIEYCINYFKTHGAPAGTTYSAGIGGFNKAAFLRSYVPSVDYLQYNAYNHNGWRSPLTVFKTCYDWINELPASARSKPIIVAEWGCTYPNSAAPSNENQRTWNTSVASALAQLPKIKIANYFNSGWGTLNAEGLNGLIECYSKKPFI